MMLAVTLALLGAIIGLTYLFLNFNYGYWKKRGVPGPKPQILNGNYPSIFNQKHHMAHDLELIYREYKKSHDFVGIFSCRAPQLLILNPQLVRRVYVTDFKHFHDNETTLFIDEKSDFIFANNPFALSGEKWKERRAEVTPGLTASRIKSVYPVTKKVVKRLTEHIEKEMKMGTKTGTDAKDMCLRFTSDVVSDCVLGIYAGSFEEKGSEILTNVKNLFDQSFLFQLYFAMVGLLPWLRGAFRLRFIPKQVETFFFGLMDNAIALRRQQAETQANRADFMNYLLELQKKKSLSNSQLTAHTMTFLLDGFETTASVIAHCLLLLGRHQDIQEKLLAEILENVDKNGDIDFDKLNDLPYLDACIHEAIRIFPPAFFGSKLCTEPITLTNKDGSSVQLRKNDTVMLPIYSIMADEEFYPNPQEFKPERFLEEADSVKAMREKGLYYGFGDGPRVCLGMRFALTQTKAALVEIVQHFVVKVNSRTRSDNRFDPKYFLTQIDGGIFLDFERRN